MPRFRCAVCSHTMESVELDPACRRCGSAVVMVDRVPKVSRAQLEDLPAGVWRYRAFLPEVPGDDVVTLGEGGTPLLPAERLGKELGLSRLLIKDESRNPTGSFIDRGSTVLVSLAKERGVRECACVTTGNLGASLAAYCAKGAISAKIRIQPSTDRGKLYQMLAYGAQVEAPSHRPEAGPSDGASLSVTAGNPYILEGEKTTCFEIVHDLGWKAPDVIVVPVGTGGHLSMIWKALLQLRESGLVGGAKSRLLGVRFEGSAQPKGFRRSRQQAGTRGEPFTELEESEPFFMNEAAKAMKDSRGMSLMTTANETIRATSLLARTEGIFSEPASASVIASLEASVERGFIRNDDTVVCVITGAGLKDTKAVSRLAKATRRVPVRQDYTLARMQIGETKLALLRLLAGKPCYGYGLWQRLNLERKITTASVYQHLTELEAVDLLRRAGAVSAKGRERVPYNLTRKGIDFLRMAGNLERESGEETARS